MGKVKEIFTEVQEMFDGEIPADFDMDAYFAKRANEIKEAREKLSEDILSDCCFADMTKLLSPDGPSLDSFPELMYRN